MSATNFPWPAEPDLNLDAGVFTSLVERASLSVDRGAGEPSVADGQSVLNLALQRATELANPATTTDEDRPDEVYLGGMDGLPYRVPGSSKKGVLVGTKLLELTAPQTARWVQAIRVYIHGRSRLEMNSRRPALPGSLKPLPWTDYGHIPIQNIPANQEPSPEPSPEPTSETITNPGQDQDTTQNSMSDQWPTEPDGGAVGDFTRLVLSQADIQLAEPLLGTDALSYQDAARIATGNVRQAWTGGPLQPHVLATWGAAIASYLQTHHTQNREEPEQGQGQVGQGQTGQGQAGQGQGQGQAGQGQAGQGQTGQTGQGQTGQGQGQGQTGQGQTGQGQGPTVVEQPKVGEEGWMEYLKGMFRGNGKDVFSDDVSTQQEYVKSQRANLRPFLPIAGTDAFDEQDSFESDKLKERNLMMGMVGFNPTGNITNNPFIYGNAVNTGLRFSGELFAMPEVLNGGTLTEGATLYGSYRPTPTNPMDIMPPPSTRSCRKRYR